MRADRAAQHLGDLKPQRLGDIHYRCQIWMKHIKNEVFSSNLQGSKALEKKKAMPGLSLLVTRPSRRR